MFTVELESFGNYLAFDARVWRSYKQDHLSFFFFFFVLTQICRHRAESIKLFLPSLCFGITVCGVVVDKLLLFFIFFLLLLISSSAAATATRSISSGCSGSAGSAGGSEFVSRSSKPLSLSLSLSNTLFVSHPTSLSPLPPPSLPLCSVSHLFFFFFFGGGGLFCLFFVAVLFCFSFVLFSRFLFRIPNTQCKRFMCM